ncbi:MAG TPA: sigma-70 family RNA polymerase sigma factor [Candidatus Acidoferrum sp.]|nr:sigma-70 family RNA polymerase sigma factor [Candidatus Acidoferrum sp.]
MTQQIQTQSEVCDQFQPFELVSDSSADFGRSNCNDIDTDEDGGTAFLNCRGRLFGIAYRVLKNAAEAEDVVQDVWMRWQTTDRSTVRDAAAFLATATIRLSINVIQSARWRRETNLDSSLPESAANNAGSEAEASRSEALQCAVTILLEKLSPAERAAFVLREAFDYSYREIASILRVQEASTRQLVTRARRHLAGDRRTAVNSAERRQFLAAFSAASQNGVFAELESFFERNLQGSAGKRELVLPIGSTVGGPYYDAQPWTSLDTYVAA